MILVSFIFYAYIDYSLMFMFVGHEFDQFIEPGSHCS